MGLQFQDLTPDRIQKLKDACYGDPIIYKPGDIVTVFCIGWNRELRIDGKAKIIRPATKHDAKDYRYVVQYLGKDRKHYERFIDPMGQEDPGGYVALTNAQWKG